MSHQEQIATSKDFGPTEFPIDMIEFLRCGEDGGAFVVSEELRGSRSGVISAKLKCTKCNCEYSIVDGIALFMAADLSVEDQHEMQMRNVEYHEAGDYSPCSRSELSDFIEIPPFLRALDIK